MLRNVIFYICTTRPSVCINEQSLFENLESFLFPPFSAKMPKALTSQQRAVIVFLHKQGESLHAKTTVGVFPPQEAQESA